MASSFAQCDVAPSRGDAAELDPVDLEALRRALAIGLREHPQQIRAMLDEDGWLEAAEFASYTLQIDALHLAPWETPPCMAEVWHTGRIVRDPAAGALVDALAAVGLSRFEPDPQAALMKARRVGSKPTTRRRATSRRGK